MAAESTAETGSETGATAEAQLGRPAYTDEAIESLGVWTSVLFAVLIAVNVAIIALFAYELDLLYGARNGGGIPRGPAYIVARFGGYLAILLFVFAISAFLLFLVWQYHVCRNFHALGFEGMAFTPGWSVGWWFVPVANIVQVPRAVGELHKLARAGGRLRTWNRDRGIAVSVLVWWGASLLAIILDRAVVSRLRSVAGIEDAIAGVWLALASSALAIVAAVLAIRIVRQVTRGQAGMIVAAFDAPRGARAG